MEEDEAAEVHGEVFGGCIWLWLRLREGGNRKLHSTSPNP